MDSDGIWNTAVASASWLALWGQDRHVCLLRWLDRKWMSGMCGSRGLAPAASARGRLLVRCQTLANAAETDTCPHRWTVLSQDCSWGKNVFKCIDIGMVCLGTRGWVRESVKFGWIYGWDSIATTPFIFCRAWAILKWFLFLVRFTNLEKLAYFFTLLVLRYIMYETVSGCQALDRFNTGAVLNGWPN